MGRAGLSSVRGIICSLFLFVPFVLFTTAGKEVVRGRVNQFLSSCNLYGMLFSLSVPSLLVYNRMCR